MGYINNSNNEYIEVPSKPNDSYREKWLNGKWTIYMAIDKNNKSLGYSDNRTEPNVTYYPFLPIPTDFDVKYYTYDRTNNLWVIPLSDAKNDRKIRISQNQLKTLKKIGELAFLESASFYTQEQEARAWNKDNTTSTPFLDNLLLARDIKGTKQELVNKIIKNADAYKIEYAKILGKFQSLMKKIDACTTVDEVIAINWN